MQKQNISIEQDNSSEFYEKKLLQCAIMVLLFTEDCLILTSYKKIFTDYKTGNEFDFSNNSVINRTLQDFAERFIKPKDQNKYELFVNKLPISSSFPYGNSQNDWNKNQEFVEEMFESGGFTKNDVKKIRHDMVEIFRKYQEEQKKRSGLNKPKINDLQDTCK